MTTGELSDQFDVSRYAVMKHLDVLVEAELVVIRREGRERWNHLNAVPLQQVYERWLRPYEDEWASSLLRLRSVVEEKKTSMPGAPVMQNLNIEQDIVINAPLEHVYDVLTQDMSLWWKDPYIQREGGTVRLEPHVGGRMFEDWGEGKGVLLCTVTRVEPPYELRLVGTMGIRGLVAGDIVFRLQAEDETRTRFQLSHRAMGEIDDEVRSSYALGWQVLLDQYMRDLAEGA